MTGDGVNDATGAETGGHWGRDGPTRQRCGAWRCPTWSCSTTISRRSFRPSTKGVTSATTSRSSYVSRFRPTWHSQCWYWAGRSARTFPIHVPPSAADRAAFGDAGAVHQLRGRRTASRSRLPSIRTPGTMRKPPQSGNAPLLDRALLRFILVLGSIEWGDRARVARVLAEIRSGCVCDSNHGVSLRGDRQGAFGISGAPPGRGTGLIGPSTPRRPLASCFRLLVSRAPQSAPCSAFRCPHRRELQRSPYAWS